LKIPKEYRAKLCGDDLVVVSGKPVDREAAIAAFHKQGVFSWFENLIEKH
jgi:hypothetical protein